MFNRQPAIALHALPVVQRLNVSDVLIMEYIQENILMYYLANFY